MDPLQEQIHRTLSRVAHGTLSPQSGSEELMRLVFSQADAARLALSDQTTALEGALNGMIAAISEFRGVTGQTPVETERLLRTARRRFALQLAAMLVDPEVQSDASTLALSASLRVIRDRLSQLGRSVAELLETTIRDSQRRKELELAGVVQQMLIPSSTRLEAAGLVAHSWCATAEECGGDFWMMCPLGAQDALILIGDVTGHGAPAAIVTGTMRGGAEMARLGLRDNLLPSMLLNMLNQVLVECVHGEYMMSGVAMRYGGAKNTLHLANAGHYGPYVVRGSTVIPLPGDRNPPLGATRALKFDDRREQLLAGDVLVLFTDGLVDCLSPQGAAFSERRLREVCQQLGPLGAEALCDGIRQEVLAHRGSAPPVDDLTLLAVQVN